MKPHPYPRYESNLQFDLPDTIRLLRDLHIARSWAQDPVREALPFDVQEYIDEVDPWEHPERWDGIIALAADFSAARRLRNRAFGGVGPSGDHTM